MGDDDELRAVAQVLYAAPLSEFVTVRNAEVRRLKDAGRTEVAGRVSRLRKPVAGAGLVNRLIHQDRPLAEEVAELGVRLRAAQATSDAAGLRSVDAERRALVSRSGDRARQLGSADGATPSASTIDDVEQTIWAALVDVRAAATVLAAVLVRPLSPGGFGEVDTAGASAIDVPDPPAEHHSANRSPARRREPSTAALLREAQSAHQEAQGAVDEASRAIDDAVGRRETLDQERRDLKARAAEVERSLREAATEIVDLRSTLREAERARQAAASRLDRAKRRADDIDD